MVENRIGTQKFLILYFLSGVIGAIFWIIFTWYTNVPCIGASAGLFGVMVAAAMMFPDVEFMLLFPPVNLKLKTLVLIYALLETFSSFSGMGGNVAHIAHIGGLVGGYTYMRLAFGYQCFSLYDWVKINFFKKTGRASSKRASRSWRVVNPSSKNLDEILDKISRHGINSLEKSEMEILKQARDKMRKK